jgi:hypothetical protein
MQVTKIESGVYITRSDAQTYDVQHHESSTIPKVHQGTTGLKVWRRFGANGSSTCEGSHHFRAAQALALAMPYNVRVQTSHL